MGCLVDGLAWFVWFLVVSVGGCVGGVCWLVVCCWVGWSVGGWVGLVWFVGGWLVVPLGLDALWNHSLDLPVDPRGCRAPLVGVMEVGRGSRVETARFRFLGLWFRFLGLWFRVFRFMV